jgi:hypothetical protein
VDEAHAMVAYNQRILETSQSAQRRHRAEQMLKNLAPVVAQLEREEAARVATIISSTPPASTIDGQLQRWRDAKADDEFEVVWSGKDSLSSMGTHAGEDEWMPDLETRTRR